MYSYVEKYCESTCGGVDTVLQRQASRHHNVSHHAQHTTHHGTLPNIVDRWTTAATANSIISDPPLPTLPTAWSLIDYAIGYKEIQQLSKMEGYSQSFGQARVGWTTSRHHNIATWWNEYECDAAIIVSPWLHCRKILSITTFLFKNWCQRFDIDEEMYQRSVDDGSSQYFMARIIWILWYSPHISSTSSDLNYIMSYIFTQQPT
jgi:hypothetical protein